MKCTYILPFRCPRMIQGMGMSKNKFLIKTHGMWHFIIPRYSLINSTDVIKKKYKEVLNKDVFLA